MKAILPILFFTMFCLPVFAGNSPAGSPPKANFNAYRTTNYDYYDPFDFDSVGCMSKTAYFQDDTFFPGGYGSPASYVWDFGDGTTSTVFDYQPVHTYTSPGVYT
ncbi:MAG: PKD domain-containing protein, partial [Chitinophagaceae bacterium]|nr:PKD domain-containing protein [Chitinophagaceae bacterium]